jgi:transcriptional regulator with XRE-family HTH domain
MIGEALRLIRVFHDKKQSAIAKRLGISKSYLSELESGEKIPTLALIQKYSRAFDIPVSSIMFFAENVGKKSSYERARGFVSKKIISLMKFLEERSGQAHAD